MTTHHTCAISHKAVDQAVGELRKKMDLERVFKRDIRSLFNRMANEFRASVAVLGVAPRSSVYIPAWEAILQTQYARVQRGFKGEVEAQNPGLKRYSWELKQVDPIVELALSQWADDTAPIQAREIAQTNDRDMRRSVDDARDALAEQGDALATGAALATVATQILRNRFMGRVTTIAQTETQNAAEATKQITAEGIAGDVPFPVRGQVQRPDVVPVPMNKRWQTVGDDRVRPSHVLAGMGAPIALDATFQLAGGTLRFAGDVALGASLGEVINCRCSTNYRTVR